MGETSTSTESESGVLPRSIVVSNGKGGVGKTSATTNIAGLAAERDYKVLVVDLDPQGNVGRDLGYYGDPDRDDKGQGLLTAIQHGQPAIPIKDVRPGLDVVPGGTYINDVVQIQNNFAARGRNPHLVLEDALAPLAHQYHLILIDSPPGDRYLQDIAMSCANYVIIPTRSDEASLDGLDRTGDAFLTARAVNPQLRLLGVVLFGIGASSTVIQSQVRNKLAQGLGSVAPVFKQSIRYLEAPAVEARNMGKLVHEYERDLVAKAPKWYERVRTTDTGRHRASATSADRVATTANKLAEDYARLTQEILVEMDRLAKAEAPTETMRAAR